MPFAKVNEIDLTMKRMEKETPLFYIGIFDSPSDMESVHKALVDSFQVVLLDNRGSGQSSAPIEPYN